MQSMTIEYNSSPVKTRELHNHHFDSTIWNDFAFRNDDILIATYAKSGTTWIRQIVAQLIFNGDPSLQVAAMSPWLGLRVPAKDVKLSTLDARRCSIRPRRNMSISRARPGCGLEPIQPPCECQSALVRLAE